MLSRLKCEETSWGMFHAKSMTTSILCIFYIEGTTEESSRLRSDKVTHRFTNRHCCRLLLIHMLQSHSARQLTHCYFLLSFVNRFMSLNPLPRTITKSLQTNQSNVFISLSSKSSATIFKAVLLHFEQHNDIQLRSLCSKYLLKSYLI